MKKVERVLVLRPDGIGDCIIFSGAFKWIRRHWESARIDLVVQARAKPLFEFCPHVDRVMTTDRLAPWEAVRRHVERGSWRLESLLLSAGIRKLWYPGYDVVMYPVSAPVENWLKAVRLISAEEKMGYTGEQLRILELEDARNQPEAVFTRSFENMASNRWLHESLRSQQFLAAMGITAEDMHPELWLSDEDRAFGQAHVPDGSSSFFVGAGSAWRQWPGDKWRELADALDDENSVVVLGTESDGHFARTLQQQCRPGKQVIDLTGKTTLRQLAACISRCRAVVSNDSSGLHMAVALNVPAVGLMGGYHFGRYYPWGNAEIHRTANVKMDCYYCNDDCIYHDWRCVRDIPVDTVLNEFRRIGVS